MSAEPSLMSTQFFSATYSEARAKFLQAASDRRATITSYLHPLPGMASEPLAMDVAQLGNPKAADVLFTVSGTHGIEGYCGSGSQLALLYDPVMEQAIVSGRLQIVHLHALNPHGFSHGRRVNEDNVDLNRNFVDFTQPLPANAGHDALVDALVPASWPPSQQDETVLKEFAERHGPMGQQQAISGGQYKHKHSLFYGGIGPTWSNRTLRHILAGVRPVCQRFFWLDFHTGLGPTGYGERIYTGRPDPAELIFNRMVWEQKGARLTSFYDGTSTSAPLTGVNAQAIIDALPEVTAAAKVAGVALEYGTVPMERVMFALRADHWLALHPQAPRELASAIKTAIRAAFYVETDSWKEDVVRQSLAAAHDVVRFVAA